MNSNDSLDIWKYLNDLGDEINSLKNRVRDLENDKLQGVFKKQKS